MSSIPRFKPLTLPSPTFPTPPRDVQAPAVTRAVKIPGEPGLPPVPPQPELAGTWLGDWLIGLGKGLKLTWLGQVGEILNLGDRYE